METYRFKHFPIPVYKTILPNGMTVITAETRSKLVRAEVVLPVGSLDDSEHPGIAHYLEHVVYEGPGRSLHPKLQHLYTRGIQGGASTSSCATAYWVVGLARDATEMVPAILSISFTDELDCSSMDAERGVILQEQRENATQNLFGLWARRNLFAHMPSFQHFPVGTPESIRDMRAEELHAFYQEWYEPGVALLVVAGGVDHEKMVELALAHTKTSHRNKVVPPRTPFPPLIDKFTYRKEDATPSVAFYSHLPTEWRIRRCVFLANDLLIESVYGLLRQDLRNERGIAYAIRTALDPWPYSFLNNAVPVAQEHFAYVEEAYRRAISRVIAGDYPEKLLERVRVTEIIDHNTDDELSNNGWTNRLGNRWVAGQLDDHDVVNFYESVARDEIAAAATSLLDYGRVHIVTG